MKKLIVALVLVVVLALPVWGADTKITGLTADTSPTTDDLVVTVDAPGTSPVNKKVTLGNFALGISSLFLTGVTTGNGATGPGFVKFLEDTDNGSNYGRIIAPAAITANIDWTMPDYAGTVAVMASGACAAAGCQGFDGTDKFTFFGANSEDFYVRVGSASNVNNIGSTTSALITFDNAFTATGAITASAGITVADSQVITFDESAADPNDADIQLSATDGVFKIAAANGANNEDLTIDLDQTANTAILGSSTGLTMITTGSIPLTGAVKVSLKDSDYTIGTDNANEAYGCFFFNTAASTRTFTLPSAAVGMSVCIKNAQGVSQVLRLDANTGDYIVMSTGARTSASAEYYGCSTSAACMVCVVAYDSTDWHVTAERGTWAEE